LQRHQELSDLIGGVMVKAKDRRKKRRLAYLTALRTGDPEGFREQLDKRITSWTNEIWKLAEQGAIKGLRTFALPEEARGLVTETGQPVSEILEQECCRALSKLGLNIHKPVARYGALCLDPSLE
jgi:hypothetical protein